MGAYHTVTLIRRIYVGRHFRGYDDDKGHAGVDGRSYWRFLCLLFVADTHIWQSWSMVLVCGLPFGQGNRPDGLLLV